MRRIRENSLARMKRIAIRRRRIVHIFFGRGDAGRSLGKVEKRQVLNRSRPGKLSVLESDNSFWRKRDIGPGDDKKYNVPKSGSGDCEIRDSLLDAAINEDITFWLAFGHSRPTEKGGEFAKEVLMKAVPGNRQLRFTNAGQIHGHRIDLVLTEQIERIDLESMKHLPSIISISCLP